MKWVLLGGLATLLAAAMGWVSFGHLAALLGVEILTSLWFSRQRMRESSGVVTNRHAKPMPYTVTVDGQQVERLFNPVQGKPLTTEEKYWLSNNNAIGLGVGGIIAIVMSIFADPAFFSDWKQLLVLAVLTVRMVFDEWRRHAKWRRFDCGARADPTLQMHHEFWRIAVFVGFAVFLFLLAGAPRLLAYAFAVTLFASDLFLYGSRERWSSEVVPSA